jgi:hypothetical protein
MNNEILIAIAGVCAFFSIMALWSFGKFGKK